MKRPQPLNKPDKLRHICISLVKDLEKRSARKLKKLSSKLMRELAIHYSEKRFAVTLLAYVLYKITSKHRLMDGRDREVSKIVSSLNEFSDCIDTCNDKTFNRTFNKVKDSVDHLEESDPRFLLNLVNKGKLKIGATIYAQGFSLGKASEMTGIDKHDIQNYAGKTYMFDRVKEEKTIFERIDIARRLLLKGDSN